MKIGEGQKKQELLPTAVATENCMQLKREELHVHRSQQLMNKRTVGAKTEEQHHVGGVGSCLRTVHAFLQASKASQNVL